MPRQNEKNKAKLSNNVRQMKFMKRSAVKQELKENEQEKQRIIDDEHWVLDVPDLKEKESKFTMEPSYVVVENLRKFGRLSFKGFNPEIEKLMKSEDYDADMKAVDEREKKLAISDEEMTRRFENIGGAIAKKFTKKRARTTSTDSDTNTDNLNKISKLHKKSGKPKKKKKKKEFMKPADD